MIFLGRGTSKTNRRHHPAHTVPAVAGCSDRLLNTLLHAVGVQTDLGNAVHHSGSDLGNASPALSILTDPIVGVAGRLHCRHLAEDALNAILVNLAVLGLGGDSNKQDKAENLHADLEMWIVFGNYMRCLKIWTAMPFL